MTRLKRKKELHSPHQDDVRFGTPIEVAEHRAQRLKGYDTIIEVGAGAGFQTAAFAKVADVIAIEIDAERLGRARLPKNVVPIAGDALDPAVINMINAKGKAAVFLDPERPPAAERRTLAEIEPNIERFMALYAQFSQDMAIELPPFLTELPQGEREYLSIDGKLNRLTIYTGGLKRADISVVQLPGGRRFEHSGPILTPHSSSVKPLFLLEPDAALAHAGLAHIALNTPYEEVKLGRKSVYLTERPQEFFRSYKVRAIGRKAVEEGLSHCGTLILHGAMSQEEQKLLLRKLNARCKGRLRMHLFLAENWYLTTLA